MELATPSGGAPGSPARGVCRAMYLVQGCTAYDPMLPQPGKQEDQIKDQTPPLRCLGQHSRVGAIRCKCVAISKMNQQRVNPLSIMTCGPVSVVLDFDELQTALLSGLAFIDSHCATSGPCSNSNTQHRCLRSPVCRAPHDAGQSSACCCNHPLFKQACFAHTAYAVSSAAFTPRQLYHVPSKLIFTIPRNSMRQASLNMPLPCSSSRALEESTRHRNVQGTADANWPGAETP